MRAVLSLFLAVSVCGCATPLTDRSPSPPPSPSRTASATASATPEVERSWTGDLDQLLPSIERLHPDPFHGVAQGDVESAIARLAASVASLDDDALMTGTVGVVAMLSSAGRDAHTGIHPWNPASTFPLHSLPLRLWLFPDGVHVIDALPPYQDLIGARVDTIGGRSLDEVMTAIDPIVPRDNAQTVRLLMPRFLVIPEVLHGLGLLDRVGAIELGVSTAGDTSHQVVTPIDMQDYNAWAGGYGLLLPPGPDVLYLSRMDETLWWQRLDDGTLYVQFNRVESVTTTLRAEISAAAADPATRAVVVDVRHNVGGEVSAVDPVVDLFDDPGIASHSVFVVTGRNTFSAASLFVARLQARIGARVVGEPMSGGPNAWGNARDFQLPYSGLTVSVATLFEVGADPADPRLGIDPDLPADLRFEDWAAGRDPALAAIAAAIGD